MFDTPEQISENVTWCTKRHVSLKELNKIIGFVRYEICSGAIIPIHLSLYNIRTAAKRRKFFEFHLQKRIINNRLENFQRFFRISSHSWIEIPLQNRIKNYFLVHLSYDKKFKTTMSKNPMAENSFVTFIINNRINTP